MDSAARVVAVVVSVDELFNVLSSVTPEGTTSEAVLDTVETGVAKVPESVKVAVDPTGRSTDVAIGPAVGPLGHVAPPAPTQVQESPVISGPGMSLMPTPTALDGPRFVATIVHWTVVPTTKEPTCDLAICRSASFTNVAVSVDELFADDGSGVSARTVPVLSIEPLSEGSIVTETVMADAPTGTVVAVHTTLDGVGEPTAHVQPAPLAIVGMNPAGSVSVTTADAAADGPIFCTLRMYSIVEPATGLLGRWDFEIER